MSHKTGAVGTAYKIIKAAYDTANRNKTTLQTLYEDAFGANIEHLENMHNWHKKVDSVLKATDSEQHADRVHKFDALRRNTSFLEYGKARQMSAAQLILNAYDELTLMLLGLWVKEKMGGSVTLEPLTTSFANDLATWATSQNTILPMDIVHLRELADNLDWEKMTKIRRFDYGTTSFDTFWKTSRQDGGAVLAPTPDLLITGIGQLAETYLRNSPYKDYIYLCSTNHPTRWPLPQAPVPKSAKRTLKTQDSSSANKRLRNTGGASIEVANTGRDSIGHNVSAAVPPSAAAVAPSATTVPSAAAVAPHAAPSYGEVGDGFQWFDDGVDYGLSYGHASAAEASSGDLHDDEFGAFHFPGVGTIMIDGALRMVSKLSDNSLAYQNASGTYISVDRDAVTLFSPSAV